MTRAVLNYPNVGDSFGLWVVIDTGLRLPPDKYDIRMGKKGHRAALVRCTCTDGITKLVNIVNLYNGRSTSCGCVQRIRSSESMTKTIPSIWVAPGFADKLKASVRTHGMSKHELYGTWSMMMHRCYDKNIAKFESYGARGIEVCSSWHNSVLFISEIESVLGSRPVRTTIDRIDNNGHYQISNVRWATSTEQASNKDRGVVIPLDIFSCTVLSCLCRVM
jgi:hypothetical protein